ncbi:hypothetical protein [Paraburkholderia azotifigens]|nr:hypothetical protein [Paraburkholderia azotifigens]
MAYSETADQQDDADLVDVALTKNGRRDGCDVEGRAFEWEFA